MVIPDFTKNDVDMDAVRTTAKAEATDIFNSPKARQNRSYERIYHVTEQSHIAEHYMIEHHGYEADNRKYMDIKKDGITVDIKTSGNGTIVEQKEGLLNKLSGRRRGMLVADYIMGFDIINGVYKFRYYEKVPATHKKNDRVVNVGGYTFIIRDEFRNKLIRTDEATTFNWLLRNKDTELEARRSMLTTYGSEVL